MVRQSYKHPTLCTVVVGAYDNHGKAIPPQADHYWKLPTAGSPSERNTLQHLHTVDLYFWTAQDADSFIGNVRRLLQHDQVDLLDQPPAQASRDKVISPVVQQLENVAIQDPTYQPTSPSSSSQAQITRGRQETPTSSDAGPYQPLAYNPAAPAAPEPIRHREKTPPPIDAESGTGLGAAAYADQQGYATSQSSLSRPGHAQMSHSQSYVPQAASQIPSAISPNPVPLGAGQRAGSVSTLPPPPPLSPPSQGTPSKQLVPSSDPSQQGVVPKYDPSTIALASPASQVIGNSYVSGTHQPLQHVQPQYADYLGSTGHSSSGPIGGYSNYTYTQQERQATTPGDDYSVHGQVYRPTEEEAMRDPRHRLTDSTSKPQPTKLDKQTDKVDKGVNRLFKRIEKRIG